MLMRPADDIEIITARELATHASEIKHLQDDMDRMVNDMQEVKLAIQQIQKTLAEARGGWKILMYVAGVSSALTGLASWLMQHWSK
jgi:hypothetical protein